MSSTKDGSKEQELTELLTEVSSCNTLDYLSTYNNNNNNNNIAFCPKQVGVG
jgi:hypothetical protein